MASSCGLSHRGYSQEALALAHAQVMAENEHFEALAAENAAAVGVGKSDHNVDDDDDMVMPVCMPNPDVLLQIFDGIFFSSKSSSPVAGFTHLLLRVALTLQGLMGFVLLGGAIGALSGRVELALPEDLQHLIATAGDEVGIDRRTAALLVPAAAGLAKIAAIAAFWFGGPMIELCATGGLAVMFMLVAYVHWTAGLTVLPPIIFFVLAVLKLCTAPRKEAVDKVE
mmetsp:Transcript_20871/g.53304  ORF Transcript_20871/g.53304 Transcript_20871/m.53304 type:complete len:226 (+) Transcript_20871:123-800(+)